MIFEENVQRFAIRTSLWVNKILFQDNPIVPMFIGVVGDECQGS